MKVGRGLGATVVGMSYPDYVTTAHGSADTTSAEAMRLARANINPKTGLATDYLNHFSEAIMLLELLPGSPEFRDDFLRWRPSSYREHFSVSRSATHRVAIAAYERADPYARTRLDALAGAMTAVLEATRAALRAGLPHTVVAALAHETAAVLKPLVARAGAVINGEAHRQNIAAPQVAIDDLMKA